MASIKIFDLNSQSFTSDLIDSELKNIQGGWCYHNWRTYTEGSIVEHGGKDYICVDNPVDFLLTTPDIWLPRK